MTLHLLDLGFGVEVWGRKNALLPGTEGEVSNAERLIHGCSDQDPRTMVVVAWPSQSYDQNLLLVQTESPKQVLYTIYDMIRYVYVYVYACRDT